MWSHFATDEAPMPSLNRSIPGEVEAIIGRRTAQHPFEHAVKMREGLKTDFVGDFADPQIGIQQKVSGFFNAHAGDVFREIDAGDLFELLAKIETAHVDRLGNLIQGKFLALVIIDELLGSLFCS
jgi:hypothetical protein